jgi:hypothetical protein
MTLTTDEIREIQESGNHQLAAKFALAALESLTATNPAPTPDPVAAGERDHLIWKELSKLSGPQMAELREKHPDVWERSVRMQRETAGA